MVWIAVAVRPMGRLPAGSVALCELWRLSSERGQIGAEHGVQQIAVRDARSTDDLAELQAAQAGGHNVVCGHPWHRAEVQSLALVEFGRDHSGAQHLDPHTSGPQLLVQHL